METINDYISKAKDLAEDAGEAAKAVADDVVSSVRELTEDGSRARELMNGAKEKTSAIGAGAKEMVQGMMQDARAVREIRQGVAELEALPEIEGSIIYKMETETIINSLNSLVLTIGDKRLDDGSVAEEIRKVMDKVKPDDETQTEEPAQQDAEQQAINNAKIIAYGACERALETLDLAKEV